MESCNSEKIVTTCLSILNNETPFVEGCREIVFLRNKFGLTEDTDFLPFVGVVSETDDYPSQDIRNNFSESYLKTVDQEISNYISEVRPVINESCNLLISKFKNL